MCRSLCAEREIIEEIVRDCLVRYPNSKLLSSPTLCSDKGVDVANAAIHCLEDWNINNIEAMCLDTGNKQRAGTFAESKLERLLLQLKR